MTLIKQEKLVHIGYLTILYIREYLCVFIGTRVSKDFQFRVPGSRNNQKHTALMQQQQQQTYI